MLLFMLNNVSLTGRLTNTPELRYTTGDISVTSFTLAVERDYKTNGEKETDFFDVTAWRGTAEFACKYFEKGQLMTVTGSIQTRKYTDKEGNNRKAVEILANKIYFADSKKQDIDETVSSSPVNDGLEIVEDDDMPNSFDPFA